MVTTTVFISSALRLSARVRLVKVGERRRGGLEKGRPPSVKASERWRRRKRLTPRWLSEALDLLADRRLGQRDLVGGAREAQMPGRRIEGDEQLERRQIRRRDDSSRAIFACISCMQDDS